jgi:hypothetical protein
MTYDHLLHLVCQFLDDPLLVLDYIDEVLDDILVFAKLACVSLAREVLDLQFEIVY